jgi:hypothetical protein
VTNLGGLERINPAARTQQRCLIPEPTVRENGVLACSADWLFLPVLAFVFLALQSWDSFFSFSYFILHIAHNCKNSRILFSNTSLIMLLIGTLFIYFFHFVCKEHNNDVVLTKNYTEVL